MRKYRRRRSGSRGVGTACSQGVGAVKMGAQVLPASKVITDPKSCSYIPSLESTGTASSDQIIK
jgi:hypothetical protein